MINLFEAFLWRVAIIAGIFAALIAVVILVRAIGTIGAWWHEIRSRSRQVSQTPPAQTRHPVPGARTLPIPRHSTPARRPAGRDIAQNGAFHDAA
jgi:hypothetical protein